MLAIILLVFGIATRFIIHEPNFTPVVALALFSGAYLNRRYAILLPLALMMTSDVFLGLHNTIFFTWGCMMAVAFLGVWLRNHKNVFSITATSLLSAVIFFIVTNFGVWCMGWYPATFTGLTECFILAVPFFRATAVSTLVYTAVFFGVYELVKYRVKETRFARVLLSHQDA